MQEQQIRTRKGLKSIKIKNRNQAIVLFCQHCMGFNTNEVRYCTDSTCELFQLRLGYNTPKGTKIIEHES